MTDRTGALYNLRALDAGYLNRDSSPYTLSGATALALSVLVGGILLSAHPIATLFATVPFSAPGAEQVTESLPIETFASVREEPIAAAAPDASYGTLPSARSLLRPAQSSFVQSAPLGAKFDSIWPELRTALIEPEAASPISMPPAPAPQFAVAPHSVVARAPASRGSLHAPPRESTQETATAVAAPPPDNRSFLEKLFGMRQPSGPALAYAAAEEETSNPQRKAIAPVYDRQTAVYDIEAHTVYMPDGTRLEAHSGLGSMLDDPRYVSERMRGATPPGVYDLQLREQLFHGIQAVRLIPTDNANTLGRTGLLAHPYMLGPNGDSFGCVSFKNYTAFLQAYEEGQVKRLVVVARLN